MVQYTDDHGIAYPEPEIDSVLPASRDFRQTAITAGAAITAATGKLRSELVTGLEKIDWRKAGLWGSSDLDTLYGRDNAGVYRVQTAANATSMGLPVASPGVLTVHWVRISSGDTSFQVWEPYTGSRYTRYFTGTSWSDWSTTQWGRGPIPFNSDINDWKGRSYMGVWSVDSAAHANSLINLPAPGYGMLTVLSTGGDASVQVFERHGGDGGGQTYKRFILAGSNAVWGPWLRQATEADIGSETGGTTSEVGLTNDLLKQDFSRRHGGRIKTGGKGAACFRFDHGLASFRDKVLPLLQTHGIIGSQAINSRNWHYPENEGVSAETVNAWVTDGLVEVWNHSATHQNPTTTDDLVREIVTGLRELQNQLPDAHIDGWVIPGVGQPDPYMGFGTGTSIQQFYQSEAGRMILRHHAVSTGHITGTHQRILDGTIRQGQASFGLDSRTFEEAKIEVDYAVEHNTGVQFMLHPSQLDLPGRMTSSTFEQVVNYVAAAQAAGDLVILSPYQMMLADSTI